MTYEDLGRTIGQLVDLKNAAYGDSFHQAGEVLRVLYPNGVSPDQYTRMLYTVRVIDKLFRLATQPDAFGEDPAQDIAGYSILMSSGAKPIHPDCHEIDKQASVGNIENEVADLMASVRAKYKPIGLGNVGNGL